MEKTISANLVDIGPKYKAWYFESSPPRLEVAITFDADNYSRKLLFRLMDITHSHGFACAAPRFVEDAEGEQQMLFSIGTNLPSSRSLKKYSKKLCACLDDVFAFNDEFVRQLDFSLLDMSMFDGVDLYEFDPMTMATIRDQHYSGSWDEFRQDMLDDDRKDDAELIDRCEKFEKVNEKDMALVGAHLEHLLDHMLVRDAEEQESGEREVN